MKHFIMIKSNIFLLKNIKHYSLQRVSQIFYWAEIVLVTLVGKICVCFVLWRTCVDDQQVNLCVKEFLAKQNFQVISETRSPKTQSCENFKFLLQFSTVTVCKMTSFLKFPVHFLSNERYNNLIFPGKSLEKALKSEF